jgi:magnesium transporter
MTATSTPELLYLLHGDPAEMAEALHGMRPADIAEALEALPPAAAARVLAALPLDRAVQVFDEPSFERERCGIVQQLDAATAGPLIEAMSADQRAELFREIPEEQRRRFLSNLSDATKTEMQLLLKYSPRTAGGIMTTEFVGVPADWTVEQVIEHIRKVAKTKETVYSIYVLDTADKSLNHTTSPRPLLSSDPKKRVGDLSDPRRPLSVRTSATREEVARLISKYDLLAVPVVDEQDHVLGIVTVDDVIDAIVQEQTEDVQRFGGVQAFDEPYIDVGFVAMIKKRAGWLCALFLGEMLTATAMGYFENEISRAVVLALFIPLIISSGGNSGSQATSLIIRAMALRELSLRDWWKVALRELPSGIALGAILGSIGVVRILLWQRLHWYDYGPHFMLVALTVGCALIGVVSFGSLAGSMLPFLLRRLGFDPASASAPFVATLVDVTGLVIYFSVAMLILRGTLL